jgi:soluble lytic murein transglycosylase
MRGHLLVLLVVIALIAPATRAGGGASMATLPMAGLPTVEVSAVAAVDAALQGGQQLVRRGDYAQAEQFYADVASRDPSLAPRALLLQARASLLDGDQSGAESLVQQLLADYPNSDQVANAYFALEQIRRATGDCAGALRALDAFESTAGPTAIGPYAALQRAQCAANLGDWPTELAAAQSALGIEGGGPRLTQIEALERAAEADIKMGRKQQALDLYNRSLSLAGTRAYTAEMLFTTASVARSLGQADLAAERFRAVLVDYADQARGPGALDALIDLGRGGTVSPLQAGVVRLNAHDYRAAIDQFDQVDPGSPDWGTAQLDRVEAELKLSNDDAARAGLQDVIDSGGPSAGAAWLRLGQLDERDGDEASAEARYQTMAQVAPDRAGEALFHVGFTRFVRGDRPGALAAWRSALASGGPPSPTLQAQLEYWMGKALSVGSTAAEAQDAFNHAAADAPESFYGLRAQEQISPGTLSIAALPPTSAAWLSLSANDAQERSSWFAALNLTPERAAQDVLPALRRADTLLDLGLSAEASWEIDGVVQQYAKASDVAHMSAVADWTSARDLPQLTLRIGKQMRDMVGLNGLPRALQKQVYPAGWGDLVAEQAAAYGVDPLLMLALIRQESSFDPRAQSGAQAMGLTQVVPQTARNIAGRLGRDDFVLRDLFKPSVSIEFGTWFLQQLLGEYKGRVFPTLAAYDAGGGNVTRWLQRFGDDPDLLVEQIPFAETQSYLRIVYDNYWHYEALYRSS